MPGIQTITTAGETQNLLLRPTPYAPANYGIDGDKFTNVSIVPRPRFLFYARFVRPNDTPLGGSFQKLNSKEDGIAFQIKTMDLPKFNVKTEQLNQYNKTRIIQTKIDYDAMTISAHDDVSDRMLKFWSDYYAFYYAQGRKRTTTDWADDVVKRDFNEGQNALGWGLKAQYNGNGGAQAMHYLEAIEIVRFYGNQFNVITFVLPKITLFDHDGNDYAEGREGTGIRMQFDYEGVIYSLQDQNINQPEYEGLREQLGFRSDYYDPPGQAATIGTSAVETQQGFVGDLYAGLTGRNTSKAGKRIFEEATTAASSFTEFAGSSVLSDLVSFGTGAFGTATESLTALTAASGINPPADLVAKQTGVTNKVNLFGTERPFNIAEVFGLASNDINTGIDSGKIDEAASILTRGTGSLEQPLGDGISTIADSGATNDFSRTMGNAAALARNQGLVGSIASFDGSVTPTSAEADAVVNKLPNGDYRLTNAGAGIMNSLRDVTSSLGVRTVSNPSAGVNTVDSDKRSLAALTGRSNVGSGIT